MGTYVACARFLTSQVGVGAIPPSSFYDDPADGAALVRFSFCQPEDLLVEAVDRLGALSAATGTERGGMTAPDRRPR